MTPKRRILLLDDNYESMKPLKDALEVIFDFEVVLSAEATLLTALATNKFDLLIVDHMISPKGLNPDNQEVDNIHFENTHWHHTGPEFVRRLRAGNFTDSSNLSTRCDVPIIMLSAVADASMSRTQQKELQVSAYMEKPFDVEKLIAKIQAIFGE